MAAGNVKKELNQKLQKCNTGISGFDEISEGGLPKNRPTIVCGNAGSGKSILAMEFLVQGAVSHNESGVFFSFEESQKELVMNMASLNFNLQTLIGEKKLYIEHLEINKSETIDTGKYDLEGLFVRLQHAVKSIGAKRVVIDSLDALFYNLNTAILRQEMVRLFRWLKNNNVTALITAGMENNPVIRYELEQYVADCVILLDSRVVNQIATRRLRIVKMRGSDHGINEYPFIIDNNGLSVLPIISELKNYQLSKDRITTGINDLDGMLDGKGYFQGSSILVSGSAGTGKTSIATALIEAVCQKKIRSLYCAFEESTSQILRNMGSIGIDLAPYLKSGVLKFYSSRPTLQNLELHLISIKKLIELHKPEVVVLDPITNIMTEGINSEIRQMLTHFVDFLKAKNITGLFTAAITLDTIKSNPSDEGISAMVDTWILVRDVEENSERNRVINVLKSRGMNHSTQTREFVITNNGIRLLPIYISSDGILIGTAKLENTLREEEDDKLRESIVMHEKSEINKKRKIMEEGIAELKLNFEAELKYLQRTKVENALKKDSQKNTIAEITNLRNNKKSSAEKSKTRNK